MQNLEKSIEDRIKVWLNGNYDQETKAAIQGMLDNKEHEALTEAFYKDLEFGTGGIRGIMGHGPNRINKYTIGAATQGLCNYLIKTYPNDEIKVAIAHDCRNNSDKLAAITADVFSANDIKVFFFEGLRPTPELSFAIRHLGCKSGVMLTASHNPREYNGYKAYDQYGSQLVTPADTEVMEEVRKITSVDGINFERKPNLICSIGEEIDKAFLEATLNLSISKEAIKKQKELKIVFSPIHGTGIVLVPKMLEMFGFENVAVVEEQSIPDGNFPTVIYPNPEEHEAMTLALKQAKAIDADLVMATDPDADRVGIAVKDDKGEFILLSGNQTGTLLINYMLTAWEKAGKLTGKEYIVKTIVSSYLMDKIAASKNVACFNTLTGFKHIGKLITELLGQKQFIVGGEESYGYLIGDYVRDKDAVASCALIAEMTAFYKDQGISLFEAMVEMYVEFGLYREKLIAITKKGKSGAEEIKALMEKYRNDPPATLAGSKVTFIKDYQTSFSSNLLEGSTEAIDLPKSNVLQFYTEDGSIISARPSGTEPKIKFYCSVNAPLVSKEKFHALAGELDAKIDALMGDLMA